MRDVLGDDASSLATIHRWFAKFQRGRLSTVESRCAASSQRTSPHFCCCHSCYSRLQLWTPESPAIFSRPGSIWLPCVPIFERFATWTDIWERWNCHSGHKWLVWTARWKVLHWWSKITWTSLGKMHCAWRRLCRKTVKRLCSWSIVSVFFSLLIEQPLYMHKIGVKTDRQTAETVQFLGHWPRLPFSGLCPPKRPPRLLHRLPPWTACPV